MAKLRYSNVRREDKLNATDDGVAADDKDTTLYQFDVDERHEEDDRAAVYEKADIGNTASTKQLPCAEHSKLRQPSEGSEDETDEHADGTDDNGFHPARLHLSPDTSLLRSSSTSTPMARLVSFLRLNLNRYYVVLLVALLAISCSGTLLRELPNTPPLLKGQHRIHHRITTQHWAA